MARATPSAILELRAVSKTFVLHLRGGVALPVLRNVAFAVEPGECVVLSGPSGTGKSSILRMIFGNYRCDGGAILVADGNERVDVATASPRRIVALRRTAMGYVSQFLRVIPRVSALDVVTAAARDTGAELEPARRAASALLERLNLPSRLWGLPPATFSGGEQQRVNIARGFAAVRPLVLLDEPTASLDAANRQAVIDLIEERKRAGAAVLGIFHDADVGQRLASRRVDVTEFASSQTHKEPPP